MARDEYSSPGRAANCNSTTVPKFGNSCIFYDVTQGDIVGACVADGNGNFTDCYHHPAQPIGVLSLSNTSNEPAYAATPGWDFATGIGSVNAWNLLSYWPNAH
jgi:hypothetical protein